MKLINGSGNGKEYNYDGELEFEGKYLNGKWYCGKKYYKGKLEFEGKFRKGYRLWNGKWKNIIGIN